VDHHESQRWRAFNGSRRDGVLRPKHVGSGKRSEEQVYPWEVVRHEEGIGGLCILIHFAKGCRVVALFEA